MGEWAGRVGLLGQGDGDSMGEWAGLVGLLGGLLLLREMGRTGGKGLVLYLACGGRQHLSQVCGFGAHRTPGPAGAHALHTLRPLSAK